MFFEVSDNISQAYLADHYTCIFQSSALFGGLPKYQPLQETVWCPIPEQYDFCSCELYMFLLVLWHL